MDQRRHLQLIEQDYARMLHKVETMRRGAWPEPWPPEPDPGGPAAYLDRAMAELRGELTSRKPEENGCGTC